jgi:GST-like protein
MDGNRDRTNSMIRFYYNPAPNPVKVALFLEEAALPYEVVPVDTRKGEQHTASFRAINANGKVPAIVDGDGPGGAEVAVFDSNAILLYLGDKIGRFVGSPADRGELLSWLMFIATGLGPYSGQAVHFQRAAPEPLPYAINRYRREAERHYQVLDGHLDGRDFIVGRDYSIVDMAAWGWVDRAGMVLPGDAAPLAAFPNVQRWFEAVDARPAAARVRELATRFTFKQELDEEARRALFPSNYPPAAE